MSSENIETAQGYNFSPLRVKITADTSVSDWLSLTLDEKRKTLDGWFEQARQSWLFLNKKLPDLVMGKNWLIKHDPQHKELEEHEYWKLSTENLDKQFIRLHTADAPDEEHD